MDFMVEIKCEKCKCKFQLRPVDFCNRAAMECPNCGRKLDQSVFDHLQNGILELSQVPGTIPENADSFSADETELPRFHLRLKEYDLFSEYGFEDKD